MFLASNICWVNSEAVATRYCWLPRAVNGEKPVIKKWSRGKGTRKIRIRNLTMVEIGHTHVDGELSEVRVHLTGETKGGRDTGHDHRYEVIEVTVGGGGELQGAGTDIIESLVIETEGLVSVLHQLLNGESGVIRLK
jgi:hypothetical protein